MSHEDARLREERRGKEPCKNTESGVSSSSPRHKELARAEPRRVPSVLTFANAFLRFLPDLIVLAIFVVGTIHILREASFIFRYHYFIVGYLLLFHGRIFWSDMMVKPFVVGMI